MTDAMTVSYALREVKLGEGRYTSDVRKSFDPLPLVIYIIHTTSDLLSAIWRLSCGCHMCMFPKVLRIHVVGAEPTKEGVTAKCFMTGLIQLYRSYEGPIPIPLLLQASPLTLTSVRLE